MHWAEQLKRLNPFEVREPIQTPVKTLVPGWVPSQSL